MPVVAAIDHVQHATGAVTKHHHRLIGEVHPHHRLANRQDGDFGLGFSDDGRIGLVQAATVRGGFGAVHLFPEDILPSRFGGLATGHVSMMVVDPATIAAQALGDMLRRVIERRVGVGGLAFTAQLQASPRV